MSAKPLSDFREIKDSYVSPNLVASSATKYNCWSTIRTKKVPRVKGALVLLFYMNLADGPCNNPELAFKL